MPKEPAPSLPNQGFPGVGHRYEVVISFASASTFSEGAVTRGKARDFDTGYDVAMQLYKDLDSKSTSMGGR